MPQKGQFSEDDITPVGQFSEADLSVPAGSTTLARQSEASSSSAASRLAMSFGQGLGVVPEKEGDLMTGAKFMGQHPWESLKLLGGAMWEGQKQQFQKGEEMMQQPGVLNKIQGAGETALAAFPGIGPSVSRSGEQIAQGDYAGAAGTAMAVAVQVFGPELAAKTKSLQNVVRSRASMVKPTESIYTGVRPLGIAEPKVVKASITRALPDLIKTEQMMEQGGMGGIRAEAGVTATEQLAKAADLGSQKVWNEYKSKFPNTKLDPTPIETRILDEVANHPDPVWRNSPEATKVIDDATSRYNAGQVGTVSPDQLNIHLRRINAQLDSFYSDMTPSERATAKHANPAIEMKEIEGQTVRNMLDSVLEKDATDLRGRFADLAEVRRHAISRRTVAARQATNSLASRLIKANVAGELAASGAAAFTGHPQIAIGAAAVGLARMIAKRHMIDAATSDALIEGGITAARKKFGPPLSTSTSLFEPSRATAIVPKSQQLQERKKNRNIYGE